MCGKPSEPILVVVEVNGFPLKEALEMALDDLGGRDIEDQKRLIRYINTLLEIEDVLERREGLS